MTRYDVTAWCSVPHYATFEVEAESVQDALAKAREQVLDENAEPCDGGEYHWDQFQIVPADGDEPELYHLEPEARLSTARPRLLDALCSGTTAARDVVARWEKGDLAEAVRALTVWLRQAEAAVNDATASAGDAK